MPLSFFTNSGNSYGSAIPFQRIVEPAQLGFFLNLEQAELLRIQRYNEGWRFYYGKHWIFDREDGEPLVTLNYFRKIIDKGVAFLCSKGFVTRVPDPLEEITKPYLDEVWSYNRREQLTTEIGTMGAVTGDVFVMVTYEEPSVMQQRINPFSQGHIRINLLGSEQVYPTWDPLNIDTLVAVRIETIYYAERGTRQLDREDRVNHEGRQLYTKRFTQIITPHEIVEQYHGEMPVVRQNLLGEIPLVHIKNKGIPKEYYGLPDGQDLIDLQREINEKSTDISDTINYHSAPITVITGAKAKQLERGPRAVWSGLPADAKVQNLQLGGDLTAAVNYWDRLKKCMHELSDTPEGSLGSMQPISNTSGVALHTQYQPLIEKTRIKRIYYQPGFEQINYFILRIGMVMGLINLPFDIDKHSGGRIVEVETGEEVPVWDTEKQEYVNVKVRKKKAYRIDKETLEFMDPVKVRLKWWRQYGFGGEVREMTLEQIKNELAGSKSFWDYAAEDAAAMEKWQEESKAVRERNDAKIQGYQKQVGAMPQTDEMGNPVPAGPAEPDMEKEPEAPIPTIKKLPMGEIDVPEEPELVTVVTRLLHPETGVLIREEKTERLLVPVSSDKVPAYLNPFENTVEFNDVLPKDEALQAQLYQQYQTAGWVDEEWVRERIPEIAACSGEIRKRLKAKQTSGLPGTATTAQTPPAPQGAPITDLAPSQQQLAAVPGPGGNPVSPGFGETG